MTLRILFTWLALYATTATAFADQSFTFFMTADTHYGLDLYYLNEPSNKQTIDAMNKLPGTAYPASLGGVVDAPNGVLVAGDLTDTSVSLNFFGSHTIPSFKRDGFNDDYKVDGTGRLKYPVYEGYGNHDVDNTAHSYTLDGIKQRNLERPGVTEVASDGLAYSWDWEGVHFINLNIYPGATARTGDSLAFLISDLQNEVGNSGRPVVLMQHFGFDDFSLGWWTDAERQAYADALAPYNILGIFHGHLHTTLEYQWNGYDVFDGSAAKDGNFLVVRIDNGKMDVASREDNQWGFTFSKTYQTPEPSTIGLALIGLGIVMVGRWGRRRN